MYARKCTRVYNSSFNFQWAARNFKVYLLLYFETAAHTHTWCARDVIYIQLCFNRRKLYRFPKIVFPHKRIIV